MFSFKNLICSLIIGITLVSCGGGGGGGDSKEEEPANTTIFNTGTQNNPWEASGYWLDLEDSTYAVSIAAEEDGSYSWNLIQLVDGMVTPIYTINNNLYPQNSADVASVVVKNLNDTGQFELYWEKTGGSKCVWVYLEEGESLPKDGEDEEEDLPEEHPIFNTGTQNNPWEASGYWLDLEDSTYAVSIAAEEDGSYSWNLIQLVDGMVTPIYTINNNLYPQNSADVASVVVKNLNDTGQFELYWEKTGGSKCVWVYLEEGESLPKDGEDEEEDLPEEHPIFNTGTQNNPWEASGYWLDLEDSTYAVSIAAEEDGSYSWNLIQLVDGMVTPIYTINNNLYPQNSADVASVVVKNLNDTGQFELYWEKTGGSKCVWVYLE